MTATFEQAIAAQKTNMDLFFGFSRTAFAGVEKLVELNLTATRAAMDETAQTAQSLMGAKDAQELIAMQAGLLQPVADKTAAYGRHMFDITSGVGSDFAKAFEAQSAQMQQSVLAMIDTMAKNAPAGSETSLAMFKNAIVAGNDAVETAQKAIKQAVEVAQTNINTAASTVTQAAKAQAKKR